MLRVLAEPGHSPQVARQVIQGQTVAVAVEVTILPVEQPVPEPIGMLPTGLVAVEGVAVEVAPSAREPVVLYMVVVARVLEVTL